MENGDLPASLCEALRAWGNRGVGTSPFSPFPSVKSSLWSRAEVVNFDDTDTGPVVVAG
jgi:hypothetical protein